MRTNVDNTKTINILSLCTGYGGLELGLSRALAGVFRVVAVEVEAYALANLAAKAQEGKLAIEAMWPDLKTFPAQRFRGCFDFILAGYPCQPFSVAGKRKGTSDPRHLWPHIARIVQAVRPVWCFFENVPGHLTIGFGEVYRNLRDMDYSVEAGLFSAAECSLNHKRERLYFLAHSKGEHWNEFPLAHTREVFEQKIWMQQLRGQNMPIDDSLWGKQGKYVFEPRICRRNDGGQLSVDRRRLLGNGVVPQQAEKAFRYLIEKFEIITASPPK